MQAAIRAAAWAAGMPIPCVKLPEHRRELMHAIVGIQVAMAHGRLPDVPHVRSRTVPLTKARCNNSASMLPARRVNREGWADYVYR